MVGMRLSTLVVDDCEIVAASVTRALRGAGFDVTVAHSCAEARRLVQERQFLAFVLDVRLDDGSGLDLAEWLKRGGYAWQTVLHTGSTLSADDQERAKDLAVVVTKGASTHILVKAVAQTAQQSLNRMLTDLAALERRVSTRRTRVYRASSLQPIRPSDRPLIRYKRRVSQGP
jgi:DNA-binding NtrC family response regulator